MQIYLVGGAVRDKLLGLPIKERDYVVVGATPDDLKAQGFLPVGKDFPVFLHPQTREEYALARTERKTAPGYTGFAFHAAPDVTLEEDLQRRDLTINAMAEKVDGTIIDPFGGQKDLTSKWLRHVSPAFSEDPVRILRLARFLARFASLGFRVAPETLQLMQGMVTAGEVSALVAERVWKELERALMEPSPDAFFVVLRECGALAVLFPELDRLYGVPNPAQHHPEIDTGIHTMMVLQAAAKLSTNPRVRFAALLHDLGKGLTPKEHWPKHHGHEQKSVDLVKGLCTRYRVPTAYQKLAVRVAAYHGICHRALELRPETTLELFEKIDAFRQPEGLEEFLLACEADSKGRTGYEERPYPQSDHLKKAFAAACEVDVQPLLAQGLQGEDIKKALHQARVAAIRKIQTHNANQ